MKALAVKEIFIYITTLEIVLFHNVICLIIFIGSLAFNLARGQSSSTANIVLNLVDSKRTRHHILFVDNYCTFFYYDT